MTPELHRPLPLRQIPKAGTAIVVEASEAEREALARRVGLPAIAALRCEFMLHPLPGGAVAAHLHLRAEITQICVVTLDPFAATLVEEAHLRFVPSGRESDDPDPEAPDEIPFEGEAIDLGEAAAEQLALALDPYPRKPGVMDPGAAESGPAEAHPFAGLAGRTRPH